VHAEVITLLDVQVDDGEIFQLEAELEAMAPRIRQLAAETARADQALHVATAALDAETRRQRDLQARIEQHRDLVKRNEHVLNTVASPREAAAAVAQAEQARRMLADDERELAVVATRMAELRANVSAAESQLGVAREMEAAATQAVAADRAALEDKLRAVRDRREAKAAGVSRTLLQRYDRIQRRQRSIALFALRGDTCSNCDTMIPMQRRNAMSASGVPEVCEGCGVLLYATD
jgi:predicted  nucleic acid-binding Zn-ribbon protein